MLYETQVGHIASVLSLVMAAYAALAAGIGARRQSSLLIASAYRGVVATLALVGLAAGALIVGLVTHDFQAVYVWEYSSTSVPWYYNVSSLWAGQPGSLILWSGVLAAFSVAVVWQHRTSPVRDLLPWVVAVLMTAETFFLGLLNFSVDAWQRLTQNGLPFTPTGSGNGLMPLLLNPAMMAHPPALYTGYVGFAVPFAFAIAALITGRLGDEWIVATRRWSLLAWFFLGMGLLLGGNWAYNELGWGGYWAWDPVENAALLPWLTGTAFLHSVLIQQRRGMLKVWNMVLIILTFSLTLLGTFLNRSGIVSSVHAFGGNTLGVPFVAAIAITLLVSLTILYYRLPQLGATNRLDGFLSRESAFLANNLLLIGITFAVLWGTLYPITSQALTGAKAMIGAPYYNRVAGPLLLILLLFMALGPLLSWRRTSRQALERNLLRPAILSALVAIVSLVLEHNVLASLSFGVSALVIVTVGQEFHRGARAKMRAGRNYLAALLHLADSSHSRYGGYLVHAGLAVLAIGVTGTQFFQTDVRADVSPGQAIVAGPYTLTYQGIVQSQSSLGPIWVARLAVREGQQQEGVMAPSQLFYVSQQTPMTNVDLRSNPRQDLYVTLTGHQGTQASIRILINPLTMWVWVGGFIVLFGGGLAFSPDLYERRALREKRVSRAGLAATRETDRSVPRIGTPVA